MKNKLLKLIKSVHVISHLPIYVFNQDFHLEHLFVADRVQVLPYDFTQYCCSDPSSTFLFSGILDEAFITYSYSDTILIIGPFTTSRLTNTIIQNRVHSYTEDSNLQLFLSQYLELLPYFSLGDVRDFLIHLNFLFSGNSECPYSEDLHLQVCKNKFLLTQEKLKEHDWRAFQPDYYTYRYEEQILALVQKGNTEQLRESLAELSNSVIPNNAESPLRSEKNYTIIILEKLSSLAIQSGYDISDVYRLRNFYIRLLEEKEKLIDVLYVRDCAIIHFTELMHHFVNKDFSPFIKSVMQHIGLNLYTVLKVSDISKSFFVSEVTLSSRFKKETGLSVIEYIHKRKISEAKLLLRAGLSPTEVATTLCYYDYAHFSRTFKKITGITPKAFQLHPQVLYPNFLPTHQQTLEDN